MHMYGRVITYVSAHLQRLMHVSSTYGLAYVCMFVHIHRQAVYTHIKQVTAPLTFMGSKLHSDAVAIDVKDAHVPGVKPTQKRVLRSVKAHTPASARVIMKRPRVFWGMKGEK